MFDDLLLILPFCFLIWCRGYYVNTVDKNKKSIADYIRNQLQKDLVYEQMCIKNSVPPFTGEPVRASKKTSQPL